jgi:hypothetical protein
MYYSFFSVLGNRDRALDVFSPASKDGDGCLGVSFVRRKQ